MTFGPPSYPYSGPNPDDARPHDPAARGGGSGGAQSQARRDPVAWAYDPSAQTEHDHHSRVDSPRAADRAATPYAGDQDSYGYGLAPRVKGLYEYDPDSFHREPRRARHHRDPGTMTKMLRMLMYARRLEASYYGSDPYGPDLYGSDPYGPDPYGPDPYGPDPYGYGPGPVPRDPRYGPGSSRYPPPPLYPYPPQYVPYRYLPRRKSRIAAGLLGIFLGCLGAHNFYLGNSGKAVAQLLITLLSVGALAPFSALWGFSEGILILSAQPGARPWGVDAHGVPLTS